MKYLRAFLSWLGEVYTHVAVRLGLWFLTVTGALFPAIHAADIEPTLNFYLVAKAVNAAGLFRDFFYISVVVALITIAEVVDLFFRKIRPHNLIVPLYVTAFVVMFYFVFYGIGEFSYFISLHAEKFVVPPKRFHYDFVVILTTFGISLSVEMLLAFRGE